MPQVSACKREENGWAVREPLRRQHLRPAATVGPGGRAHRLGGSTRQNPFMPGRFPVVAFDLDGTLLPTTTVSLYLAEWMGRGDEIAKLERQFRLHEISNSEVADASAAWLTGRTEAEVRERLQHAPWIAGMSECLTALGEAGSRLLLGTVTWRFAADMLADRFGFEAVSGTEMVAESGVLSGRVSRHFDEHDKLRFVEAWCVEQELDLAQVAAVGDSRSDVPLFRRVGFALALNATEDAQAAADASIDHPRPARHPSAVAHCGLRRLNPLKPETARYSRRPALRSQPTRLCDSLA
jgi:phosphoserine phosphatase